MKPSSLISSSSLTSTGDNGSDGSGDDGSNDGNGDDVVVGATVLDNDDDGDVAVGEEEDGGVGGVGLASGFLRNFFFLVGNIRVVFIFLGFGSSSVSRFKYE
jgi:hypothetical protein